MSVNFDTKTAQLKRDIAKMPPKKLKNFLIRIATNHSDGIMKDVFEVLHEEYGVGPKRRQRFIDKLNEKQNRKG